MKRRKWQVIFFVVPFALLAGGLVWQQSEQTRQQHQDRAVIQAIMARNGSATRLNTLLNQGANPNARDRDRVLSVPPRSLLTLRGPLNWWRWRKEGLYEYDTALMVAAGMGNLPAVKILLAHGAQVNEKGQFHRTVLHRVASDGNLEGARVLIAAGADVNARDCSGSTPLAVIRRFNNFKLNRDPGYPQFLATTRRREEITKLLKRVGAKG